MRIGIDFDNTIICYDKVFCNLAKSWQLVSPDFTGSKQILRKIIRELPEGDLIWQRMQGKAYGELISQAEIFSGFKEFITFCNSQQAIEIFIVSHKTEYGHFDESRVKLRDAASRWLCEQGFYNNNVIPFIPETHVHFEATREEKIQRIIALQCTHFIDDLVEVLDSPLFPKYIQRYLFQPEENILQTETMKYYSNWVDIKNALFSN